MAAYTVDFIEALKLGATNLVGWSDGAIIALLVAIYRPDVVKRLVSVSGLFNAQLPVSTGAELDQIAHTGVFQEG